MQIKVCENQVQKFYIHIKGKKQENDNNIEKKSHTEGTHTHTHTQFNMKQWYLRSSVIKGEL